MFTGIQPSLFDDPEFKEDSVRELIVAPMISRLGYLPTGSQRVIRSRTLKHPFIRVGTRDYPVLLIPDYTFLHEEKPIFVLDAKGPSENILDDDHVRQAYSYAIHPEVKCKEFGLCNGRQLAVFSTDKNKPLLFLDFEDFNSRWTVIEKFLSPKYLLKPELRKFSPDFGLKLKRLGMGQNVELAMPCARLDLFAKSSDLMMTTSSNCDFAGEKHCVTFDFPKGMLESLLAGLPKPLRDAFLAALNHYPFVAMAGLVVEADLIVRLGEEIQLTDEAFIPLIIQEIKASRFNPEAVLDDPKDVPDNIFQLRKAFKLE